MRHRRRIGVAGALRAAALAALAVAVVAVVAVFAGPRPEAARGVAKPGGGPAAERVLPGAAAVPERGAPAAPAGDADGSAVRPGPTPRSDPAPSATPSARRRGWPPPPAARAEPRPDDGPALDRGRRALSLFVADDAGPELRIGGEDRAGPRPLVLWRVDPRSGRAVPLAAGASDAAWRVRFESVPRLPTAALLVATPLGVVPGAAGASRPVALPPPPPPAPLARVEEVGARWRIEARVGPGAVLLVDHPQAGRLSARAPGRARRVRLVVDPPRDGAALSVAQRTAAGARSPWRRVAPLGAASDIRAASTVREGVER